jgi:hypothetical protein
MTARRDPPDIDDLLNENGGEIGDLYRRLPRYEPPRRLDRAVLGEAARAVHSGKPPRRQRWMVGIGSAAGLVLAAGIAWRIGHDAMKEQDAATIGAQRQTPIVVPVEPVTEPGRKHEAPAQEAAPEVPASAPAPASKSTGELGRNAARDEPRQSARQQLKKRADAAPKPLPTAAPPAPPLPAAAAPQAFPEADRERSEEQAESDKALDSRATSAGAAAPTEKQKEFGAVRTQPGSAPPSSSIELRRDTQRAPEDWLAHIHLLLREGRRQQAIESLQLFQRAHPDWTIPDDLRPLLK